VHELSAADILNLPFKANVFDLIICSEVLEHIGDHQTAVQEVVRVLKPAGNLVISVPRYWPERICWALSKEYRHSNQGHLRIYKLKKLIALLHRFGLKKWAIHYAHGLHTPFWWLKCLSGSTRDNAVLVELYHRFLVWDIMKQPRGTRVLDDLLNPILGKSAVIYLRKEKT
jgi:SAM-dependent methyltransferase